LSRFRASFELTRDWQHFDFELEEQVATIRFRRPDKLNALTFDVYADLRDLFRQLPLHGDDVRVIVLEGEGRGFCSGGDVHAIIGELVEMDEKDRHDFTRMTGQVIQYMRECPMPIVASIQGIAAGAGSVLALASDFRVLAEEAAFQFLFTWVGLSGGDMGAAYLLPRLIGFGRATELLMLGDKVDAQEALRIGLANRVVPKGELSATTQQLVQRLAHGPALAYQNTKRLLTQQQDVGMATALDMDATMQALLMGTHDHRNFYESFRDKKKPEWEGR
jgi:enoyl-CoA hydratase/carnithine racemase